MARLSAILAFVVVRRSLAQLVCESSAPVRGGRSYRWPTVNTALVAPVTLMYKYQEYNQPMISEFTGEGITIYVPPDFTAELNLTDVHGQVQERYVLRSIEIRKPGRTPDGVSQQLAHVLEAVLMHQDAEGRAYWASVVVPFSVGTDNRVDIISAMFQGSTLPDRYGQRDYANLGDAQALDLDEVFHGANFLSYEAMLPTECEGINQAARQFMRNQTIVTTPQTFWAVLRALERAPVSPPIDAPAAAWLVGTCPAPTAGGADCVPLQPDDLSTPLLEAQTLQSQAVSALRERKAIMDQALIALANVTNSTFKQAVDAREQLKNAEAELDSASAKVDQLQAWQSQAQVERWPTRAAATARGTSAVPAAPTPSNVTAVLQTASQTEATSAAVFGRDLSTLAANRMETSAATRRAAAASRGDCFALEKSPISIDSAAVRALQAQMQFSLEPLSFEQVAAKETRPSALGTTSFHLFNTGNYLRIMVSPGEGAPLAVVVNGLPRGIVFMDLHVPGEHVLDGHAAAAELQLVHLPKGGGAAVAVALRLEDAGDSDNPWLEQLVQALPRPRAEGLLRLAPVGLASLHAALGRGSVNEYFHYNGTLTRAPCRSAEWYVLEEVGRIGLRQLQALRAALPTAVGVAARLGPFPVAGLITEGVQRPIKEAVSAVATGSASMLLNRRSGHFAGLLGKIRGQRHIRML